MKAASEVLKCDYPASHSPPDLSYLSIYYFQLPLLWDSANRHEISSLAASDSNIMFQKLQR